MAGLLWMSQAALGRRSAREGAPPEELAGKRDEPDTFARFLLEELP